MHDTGSNIVMTKTEAELLYNLAAGIPMGRILEMQDALALVYKLGLLLHKEAD